VFVWIGFALLMKLMQFGSQSTTHPQTHTASTITFSRELVELLGYGDNSTDHFVQKILRNTDVPTEDFSA
jgi:hypothetical protein